MRIEFDISTSIDDFAREGVADFNKDKLMERFRISNERADWGHDFYRFTRENATKDDIEFLFNNLRMDACSEAIKDTAYEFLDSDMPVCAKKVHFMHWRDYTNFDDFMDLNLYFENKDAVKDEFHYCGYNKEEVEWKNGHWCSVR